MEEGFIRYHARVLDRVRAWPSGSGNVFLMYSQLFEFYKSFLRKEACLYHHV